MHDDIGPLAPPELYANTTPAPPPIWTPVGVQRVIGMRLGAMCTGCSPVAGNLAPLVLGRGHQFHVTRAHTAAVAAQMVRNQVPGDSAMLPLPGHSVGQDVVAVKAEAAVALPGGRSPLPAFFPFADLSPEAFTGAPFHAN